MHTREELLSIENRAYPRRRMLYIVEPYTSMAEDAMIVSEEAAVSSQEQLSKEAIRAENNMKTATAHIDTNNIPENHNGSIVSTKT